MLALIRDRLDVMNLHVRNHCVLLVEDDRKKMWRIMAIVEKYGLITMAKRKQYEFFRYCMNNQIKYSEYEHIKKNFQEWIGPRIEASPSSLFEKPRHFDN